MTADVTRLRALIADMRPMEARYFERLADSAVEPPKFGDDQSDTDRAEIARLARLGVFQTMHAAPAEAGDIATRSRS